MTMSKEKNVNETMLCNYIQSASARGPPRSAGDALTSPTTTHSHLPAWRRARRLPLNYSNYNKPLYQQIQQHLAIKIKRMMRCAARRGGAARGGDDTSYLSLQH